MGKAAPKSRIDAPQRALVRGLANALAIWGPFFAIVFWQLGVPSLTVMLLVAGALVFSVPWLLDHGFGTAAAGHALAAILTGAIVVLAWYTGGVHAPGLAWIVGVPMLAAFTSGIRAVVFWCGLSIALIGGFGALAYKGYPLPDPISPGGHLFLRVAGDIGLMLFALSMSITHVRFKQQVTKTIRTQQEALDATLEHVEELRNVLPICAHCHRIRDHEETWRRLEYYLERYQGLQCSHGLCDACLAEHYPDLV